MELCHLKWKFKKIKYSKKIKYAQKETKIELNFKLKCKLSQKKNLGQVLRREAARGVLENKFTQLHTNGMAFSLLTFFTSTLQT